MQEMRNFKTGYIKPYFPTVLSKSWADYFTSGGPVLCTERNYLL